MAKPIQFEGNLDLRYGQFSWDLTTDNCESCQINGFYDNESVYISSFDVNPEGKGEGRACLEYIRENIPDVLMFTTNEVSQAREFWNKMRNYGLIDKRIPLYSVIDNAEFEDFVKCPHLGNYEWTFQFLNTEHKCDIYISTTWQSSDIYIIKYYASDEGIGRECLEYMNDRLFPKGIRMILSYEPTESEMNFWEKMMNYGLIVE